MRVVRRMLRDESIVFAILLLLGTLVLGYFAWTNAQSVSWSYDPGIFPPMLAALIVSLRIWQCEEPRRRSYHSAVPVSSSALTLIKVVAGWLWLLTGVLVYSIWSVGMIAFHQYIAHHTLAGDYPPFWHWAIPFGAASIVYFAISIVTVGSNYPWRWLLGAILLYMITVESNIIEPSRSPGTVTKSYWSTVHGPLGIVAALWGMQAAPFSVGFVRSVDTTVTITPSDDVIAMVTIDSVTRVGYVSGEGEIPVDLPPDPHKHWVAKSPSNQSRTIGGDMSSVRVFPTPYAQSVGQWLKALLVWLSIGMISVCLASYYTGRRGTWASAHAIQ